MATSTPPDLQRLDRSHAPLSEDGISLPAAQQASFLVAAVVRHRRLVLAIAAALALGGVALGREHPPTFTAAATLQVGAVNPNAANFYGFTQAATQLAPVFSRSYAATAVLEYIHTRLGITPAKALARLSAAPLPLSPSFTISATAATARGATKLANVAAAGMIAYTARANATDGTVEALLTSYRAATEVVQRDADRVGPQHGASRRSLAAHAELASARAQAAALAAAYQNAVVAAPPPGGLVSLLSAATTATSDHAAKIELFGFTGLLVGIVLGCAVAALYEARSPFVRLASP
jgi:hypothetical protein